MISTSDVVKLVASKCSKRINKPCDPRIMKSIFSLNQVKSFGRLNGSRRIREQVETVGNKSCVNIIFGLISPNPSGGIKSHPVRNTNISFMFSCKS